MGKTHIAIALGVEAVRARKEVRFIDCARLVADLKDAVFLIAFIFRKSRDKSFGFHDDCFAS